MDLTTAYASWVTRRQALREVRKHFLLIEDFLRDCGDMAEYRGSVVLDWLGY